MDNWNNEQKPDVSVSGQFSGNPYQDQNQDQNQNQNQNTYDQPAGGAAPYVQPLSGYTQSGNNAYNNQAQNTAGPYSGQPAGGNAYGQPVGNNPYGQPNNNYANGYGQPYANYNQPSYQGPGYAPTEMEEPVGVGEWTGLLALASFVPCIGLILVLVWAFSGSEKKSKSNFCKAYLIIALIRIALYALLFIIWGASFASLIESV